VLEGIDVTETLAHAKAGTLTLEALLAGKFGGTVRSQTYGSAIHPVMGGQSIIIGLSTGGTGYGDPMDREPAAVVVDVLKALVSHSVARDVYGVVVDPLTNRLDIEATAQARERLLNARRERGVPYDEFVASWSQRKPDDAILTHFGSWPDGAVVTPLYRP
jgi:acetophenone carboxylase